MANLQHFLGRATRDASFKTRKDGTLIQTKDGSKIGNVRIAIQNTYDNGDTEFIDVDMLNPNLSSQVVGSILKGQIVTVVGFRKSSEDYGDNIIAFEVYRSERVSAPKQQDEEPVDF